MLATWRPPRSRNIQTTSLQRRRRLRLEQLEDRCLLSAGDLDPTFGAGGIVVTDLTYGEVSDATIQPDGKIVVVGTTPGPGTSTADFRIVRFNPDGSLDNSFGQDAVVTTDFAGNRDNADAVGITADGKIIAAGHTWNDAAGTQEDFALARYNSDGSLDTTFGVNGLVVTDLDSTRIGQSWTSMADVVYSLTIQPDGKILAAGSAGNRHPNWSDFALARYNVDGSLDQSFGNGGIVTTDFTGRIDQAYDVAVQQDGRIILAGGAGYDATTAVGGIARYNVDGSLDQSFGNGGSVTTLLPGSPAFRDIEVLPDETLLATGYRSFILVKYLPNGTLDTSFDEDGLVTSAYDSQTSGTAGLAVQSNGKIVNAGTQRIGGNVESDFIVTRYNPDGTIDTSFGTEGKVTTDVAGAGDWDAARALLIQPDGNILVVGSTSADGGVSHSWVLARYEGDLPPGDNTPPVASAVLPAITAIMDHPHTISVTYSDNVAVDVSSLDSSDIFVTGLNGYNEYATFVSVDTDADGSPRTATYAIHPPGTTWNLPDNGTYTVSIVGSQVSDTGGNHVVAGQLGTLTVDIAPCTLRVETYANVTDPVALTFDYATGVLYVGRDNSGSPGGSNLEAVKIHRVGPNGSSVDEYGDSPISDPDVVTFDASGAISGVPGSVLVGGLRVFTVLPDENVQDLFGGGNVAEMTMDSRGRLLFTAQNSNSVFVSDGGLPTPLFTLPASGRGLAVAPNGHIYSAATDGVIRVHDADGNLVNAAFATALGDRPYLAFGRGGEFGHQLYAIANGQLLRFDESGNRQVLRDGVDALDLAFGPDNALYLSIFHDDRIQRITCNAPPPPLGLDRWYATVGDDPMSVEWTVNVEQAGNYILDIGIDTFGVNTWSLSGGAGVSVDGGERIDFNTFLGTADLNTLSAGIHEFAINSFAVPEEAVIEQVTFQLFRDVPFGVDVLVSKLSSLFVADHPEVYDGVEQQDLFQVSLGDGIRSYATVGQLIDAFAPILHFNVEEDYPFPVDVASYPVGILAASEFGSSKDYHDLSGYSNGAGQLQKATYATVLEGVGDNANELAISYFFHYPSSNWMEHGGYNTHEGDWEGATVFIENDEGHLIPDRIAFAQHLNQEIVEWSNLLTNDLQAHLFVGLGGHATYARSGQTFQLPLVDDDFHYGNGQAFAPSSDEADEVYYLPRVAHAASQDWVKYPGSWGNDDKSEAVGLVPDWLSSNPPRGPVFQSAPGVLGDVYRWLDPWDWSEDIFGNKRIPDTPDPWAVVLDPVDEPGVLTVVGNANDNDIRVTGSPTSLTVDYRNDYSLFYSHINIHQWQDQLNRDRLASLPIDLVRVFSLAGNDLIENRIAAISLMFEAHGGAGDDVLRGGAFIDKLFGDAGKDTLYGGDGNDILHGGNGDDRLCGEGGRDELFGDADNDTLHGGQDLEADLLTGGGGADMFTLLALDQVLDFDFDEDSLDRPLRDRTTRRRR